MNRQDELIRCLRERILVFDGAMGTMLQRNSLPPGACPEEWNLSHPKVVKEIHQAYLSAGANILTTNTFGANRLALKEFRLSHKVKEINIAAVKIAKSAIGDKKDFIAGSVGPTGKFIQPFGELEFDEAYTTFKEQISALASAGVDIILLETHVDLQEIRAAILAAKDVCKLPIFASMSFTPHLSSSPASPLRKDEGPRLSRHRFRKGAGFTKENRTVTGTDPITAVTVLESLGATAVGANCSTGPEEMFSSISEMAKINKGFLFAQPNAGMPKLVDGKTVYEGSPDLLSKYAEKFVGLGVNIVGSCCGTTPEHTKAISQRVENKKPVLRKKNLVTTLTSRTKTVFVGGRSRSLINQTPIICIVGERINPTGRKELTSELKERKLQLIRKEAIGQVNAGAEIIDVNLGVPGIDEPRLMQEAIITLQNIIEAPLSIDTLNPETLESGLRIYAGKALINSISAEESRLESLLPKAKQYGAAFIGLCLDEKGIPSTVKERVRLAKKIIEMAEKCGLSREDIFLDALVLPVATNQEGIAVTLETLRRIKEEFQVKAILGISNVSYGLPRRSFLNATFLAMAISKGLDAALINPFDEQVMGILKASAVLTGKDQRAKNYISCFGKMEEEKKEKPRKFSPAELLRTAVINGTSEETISLIQNLLNAGRSALQIVNEILIPAIKEVGEKYEKGEFYLPQLILSAETMKKGLNFLQDSIKTESKKKNIGMKIIIATVKGDIHDLGKNLVIALLESYGYEVIDLGKDVSTEVIVEVVKKEKPAIVGLSALMTTTMPEMKNIIKRLKAEGVKARTIIGGAVVTEEYAKEIGADAYGKDCLDAVKQIERLLYEFSP
ncbi:MAG: homocysteine S-methyltransferase family protein [Candidatus Edwardsbacteria bacterium]